jgi:ATP-dependent Clp protease ATP-binding subunit ClpB
VPSEEARTDVMEVVREQFAPEFLNRIDDIILFNRLTRENMDYILDLQIARMPFHYQCYFDFLSIFI